MRGAAAVVELKSQSTWRLLILSALTLGIYTGHYILRQTRILNHHLNPDRQMSEGYAILILVLAYITVILLIPYVLLEPENPLCILSNGLDHAWGILVLIWAFLARSRMHFLLGARTMQPQWFNGLWMFLFQTLYFNYKVNQLNEQLNATPSATQEEPPPLPESLSTDGPPI